MVIPVTVPATTVTLIPQSINGTVNSVGTEGNFTTYKVTLASYDLIPALAVQMGQTTVLTDPNNVVVYVDRHTRKRNTRTLGPGSVTRFNGLIFNDNGNVRMACLQIDDGAPAEPNAAPDRHWRAANNSTTSTEVSRDVAGNILVVDRIIGRN